VHGARGRSVCFRVGEANKRRFEGASFNFILAEDRQRIDLALQRGNAASVPGTMVELSQVGDY